MTERSAKKTNPGSTQTDNINLIGVISDTHNLLRPEAVSALEGVDLIIHAGDICGPDVLEKLENVAPVAAVRGNNDKGPWSQGIPTVQAIKIRSCSIYVIHDLKEMNIDPAAEGFKIVISGHSHKSSIKAENDVIYLNPGSAGPRRFKLPVSLARVKIEAENVDMEIVELTV